MPLARETVVRVALALLDEVGLDGLTVRRLAERLGVQNPALYWHFKNKQDLLDRMAEALLAEAFAGLCPPASGQSWAVWLTELARSYRRALLAHRDGARVVAGADLTRSDMLIGLDMAVRVLQDAGFGIRRALIGVITIFDYTLGATFEEQAEPPRIHSDQGRSHRHGHGDTANSAEPEPLGSPIDPERFPALVAGMKELNLESTTDRAVGFEAGLELILSGMCAKQLE